MDDLTKPADGHEVRLAIKAGAYDNASQQVAIRMLRLYKQARKSREVTPLEHDFVLLCKVFLIGFEWQKHFLYNPDFARLIVRQQHLFDDAYAHKTISDEGRAMIESIKKGAQDGTQR